jgi:hypothetical protein
MSRFTAALAAEWRKLTSTALWWVLALGMAAYLAFVGAAMAFSLTVAPEGQAPPLGGLDAALTVYGVLNAVGYVFPLVVGTLLVTTEVRHKTLTQTLLAEPRRGVVLGAKLVLAAGIGLLYGVAGVVGLVAAGAPVLSAVGDGAFLGDPQVVRALLLGVLVTGLWAVLGTGFGAVVPHQVAAVVAILAFTQFVEPIARLALGAVVGRGARPARVRRRPHVRRAADHLRAGRGVAPLLRPSFRWACGGALAAVGDLA